MPPGARRRSLNPTSYVVLGLLSFGPATSYELKSRVAGTIGYFWAFAHSQLYDEPARLAADGLVTESVEDSGRRRRTYAITPAGEQALRDWLATSTRDQTEVRDLGLLKLFFGSRATPEDLLRLAHDQHSAHRDMAEEYEALRTRVAKVADRWQLSTLELGIRYERSVQQFWADFAAQLEVDGPPA